MARLSIGLLPCDLRVGEIALTTRPAQNKYIQLSFLVQLEASPEGAASDRTFFQGTAANQPEALMAIDCLAEDPRRLFPSPKGSVAPRFAAASYSYQHALRGRVSWQASHEPA